MRKQNFSEILLAYYEEVRGSISDYFRHLMIFHLDNNKITLEFLTFLIEG